MDLNKVPYKRRNQYLLWGSLVFVVLVYLLAISNTISLWKENETRKKELALAENAPVQIRSLQQKLGSFNEKLGDFVVDDYQSQEKIVQLANEFCQKHHLILREVPSMTVQDERDFEVTTVQITAQGNFSNLLKMVYYFEQQNRSARVTSVKFEKKEDFNTRKKYLSVKMILQNIKPLKK